LKAFQFILYVADQQKSMEFYKNVLQTEPTLHVVGMTEFTLFNKVKLGLMPENGIAKILTKRMQHPKMGKNIPRCELYLTVENAAEYMSRSIKLGAKLIDEYKPRDWGYSVGYVADADGHIIAFAEKV